MPTRWNEILHTRLRGSPYPIFSFGDRIIPAASVWTGSREWVNAFRSAGLVPGDRIAIALPPSPEFLAALVAAIWEGLAIAPVDPRTAPDVAVFNADARLVVSHTPSRFSWVPTGATSPPDASRLPELRSSRTGPEPLIRFLLRTSGTTGGARTVALSDGGVLSVIESHLPLLDLRDGVVVSVLPWHHSFGLVLDLLASIFAGAIIHRDPHAGRNPHALAALLRDTGATHLNTVPRTISLLLSTDAGLPVLQSLRGGTVGGAPVSALLASKLATTRLRAGYGQTEASPGIALGKPGQWTRGHLGTPVACETKLTPEGTLAFRGNNACLGYFSGEDGLILESPNRWVDTHDYVELAPGGMIFQGRFDDNFKLANGRLVDAALLESKLCRALPGVDEAAVFTDDGERLYVALASHTHPVPSHTEVAACLGPLAAYLAGVFPLSDQNQYRTAKGALDRKQLAHVPLQAA